MKPSKGRKRQFDAMSEGRSAMLVPARQELTTVEAANLLKVSRPFVIKTQMSGWQRQKLTREGSLSPMAAGQASNTSRVSSVVT